MMVTSTMATTTTTTTHSAMMIVVIGICEPVESEGVMVTVVMLLVGGDRVGVSGPKKIDRNA